MNLGVIGNILRAEPEGVALAIGFSCSRPKTWQKALAPIARLLRDSTVAHKLRATHDAESLYAVLAMPSASAA